MRAEKNWDVLTPEQRRRCMTRIKGKNTKPELQIRKALFKRGFRYKLHDGHLPGKPDLVLPKYDAVIFVHGCFWHGHNCDLFKWPKTRKEFWRSKLIRNKKIDRRNYKKLKEEGWYILTVWECALKGKAKLPFDKVIDQISSWLISDLTDMEIKGS